MDPQDPKRHHYVPVSYLKRFRSPEGILWRFDRVRQTIRRAAPKSIMYLENYNRQDHAPPGVDPNVLEIGLAREFEQKYLAPLDRLIHTPEGMYKEDVEIFASYLEIQRVRVPRQFEEMKETWRREALMTAEAGTLEKVRRGAATITFHPVARINYMHDALDRIGGYFYQMKWCLLRAADGASFVTTDSPVTLFHPAVHLPHEPDISWAGTCVYFPVDRRHLLVMYYDPRYRGSMGPLDAVPKLIEGTLMSVKFRAGESVDQKEVGRLNRLIAARSERYVVAADRKELEPFLAAADGGLGPFVRPLDDYMRKCRGGSTVGNAARVGR